MEKLLHRVTVVGAPIVLAMLIGLLLILGRLPGGKPVIVIDAGAREAFEAHLTALDDQDWERANSYITEDCQIDMETMEAADLDLTRRGDSFLRIFQIEEVWFHEDGGKALLGLNIPPGLMLPRVATMALVDGKWLVAC